MSNTKYELIKRISIPLISIAMLFSTLASRITVQDLYANEYIVMDTTQVIPPASEDDELDPTAMLMALANTTPQTTQAQTGPVLLKDATTFPDLRARLEELFGVRVFGGSKEGELYVTYGRDGSGRATEMNNEDPAYLRVIGRPAFQAQMDALRPQLIEASKLTFNDITGNEWYAGFISLPAYFSVVSGFPDGSFQGDATLTREQAYAMWALTNDTLTGMTDRGTAERAEVTDALAGGLSAWCAPFFGYTGGGPIDISLLNGDQTALYRAEMPRAEFITMVALKLWGVEVDAKMDTINSASQSPFSDITDMQTTSEVMAMDEQGMNTANVRLKGFADGKIPRQFLAAIMVLHEKGIVKGFPDGTVGWRNPLTRAEALTIIELASRVYGNEFYGVN
jgi:hypothetical protein